LTVAYLNTVWNVDESCHILLHAEFSAMDYTLSIVSKCRFFFICKHSRASKRSRKILHGGPGKSWRSPGFFWVSKRVGTLFNTAYILCM